MVLNYILVGCPWLFSRNSWQQNRPRSVCCRSLYPWSLCSSLKYTNLHWRLLHIQHTIGEIKAWNTRSPTFWLGSIYVVFSLSRSSQKGISDLYFALKRLLRGTYEKRNTAAQNLTDLIVGEFCLHFAIWAPGAKSLRTSLTLRNYLCSQGIV